MWRRWNPNLMQTSVEENPSGWETSETQLIKFTQITDNDTVIRFMPLLVGLLNHVLKLY